MAFRHGLGPVFAYDCLTSARRWQVYAGRALLIASLLVGLALIWVTRHGGRPFRTYQELARIGEGFYKAVMSIELVLALVLVPAVTAGSVCQDKLRGGLALMMATELSDAEIVLGKLASRLATVLGVLLCGLPVLAICTFLGGVDPVETASASLVVAGVAVLGTSVALTYSVWATKPHEALMATYATWAVWLLALLAWSETSGRGTPAVLYGTNPFWLVLGRRWFQQPNESPLGLCAAFFGGTAAVSAALAALSVWRIRAVTLHHASRTAARGTGRWRLSVNHRWASLDRYPVLWRESQRKQPAGWGRAIWRLYAVLSMLFVGLSLFVNSAIAPGTAGFMVAVGLLMVSVTSATALAEERSHGSLDVLLATPLSTPEIILGKWWGAFRAVPWLGVLPGVLTCGVALEHGWGEGALFVGMLVAWLVVAYGAAVTSVGVAAAAWQPRLGRAVAVSVCSYLAITAVLPTIILMFNDRGPLEPSLVELSPFFAGYTALAQIAWRPRNAGDTAAVLWLCTAVAGVCAAGLLWLTVRSFDRLSGRVPERFRRDAMARRTQSMGGRRARLEI